jgi:hypothetical protein
MQCDDGPRWNDVLAKEPFVRAPISERKTCNKPPFHNMTRGRLRSFDFSLLMILYVYFIKSSITVPITGKGPPAHGPTYCTCYVLTVS